MDPISVFSDFAAQWGPVWGLNLLLVAVIVWLAREQQARHREIRDLLREVLQERAQSRTVIAQLTVAVKQLAERLRWARDQ
jgi:hypothetical protein